MVRKSLKNALFFPPSAVILVLTPAATVALVAAMLFLEESAPLRIAAYVLSFYTLAVICVRIPRIIQCCKSFRNRNRYLNAWSGDIRLRMKITLAGAVLWNGGYAALQLGLGICHRSAWFYFLTGYYLCMATMRLFLAQYAFRFPPGANRRAEWKRYRICGWVFLPMNLALSGMMFFLIRGARTVRYDEITTIAMATYTFASFAMAIINVVRYRRFDSPVYSASKAISLASACVSMITLEDTMLTTFRGDGMTVRTQTLFLALTGSAVALFIVVMAIDMITKATREMKYPEENNER